MNILGIGSEIVECLRIAHSIQRHGELFINRVYTSAEIEYCRGRKQATQHFAGHWAAKEAIFKALGTSRRPGIRWLDVEVRPGAGGKLGVRFRGGLADLALQQGIHEVLVSISHSRSHVVAFAMALGKQNEEDPEDD